MATVSIGLPVFNGERYIEEAVHSLLSQTYQDFELIICDNASVDRTGEICRALAEADERVKYLRNSENIGAGPNFNLAFKLSSGKYFKWAAHDDLCAPEYLAACIDVLERDPSVVLCHSGVVRIDQWGEPLPDYPGMLEGADSPNVVRRFRALTSLYHSCLDVFGVIRREVLAQTSLIASYVGADRNLLVELGLRGRFHRVPARLFFSRDHPDRSLRALRFRERASWWDPKHAVRCRFPWWRFLGELLRALKRSPLPAVRKIQCALTLLPWLRESWRFLYSDLQEGLRLKAAEREPQRPGRRGERVRV